MNSLVLRKMTTDEAQDWKSKVGGTANQLRTLLFEGYERGAWEALGYDNWTDCVKSLSEEYGISERHLWRLHAANETEKLLTNWSVGEISESVLRPLTKLEPELQPVVYQRAVETAPNGKVTAAHVEATAKTFVAPKQPTPVANYEKVADDRNYNSTAPVQAMPVKSFVTPTPVKLTPTPAVEVLRPVVVEKPIPVVVEKPTNGQPVNSMAVHFSSDSPEHYTPREIIDAAIAVMGGIDLDPCSNSKTAPNVPALDHFTIADDGLSLPWFGRIYMNPPYGRVIGDWVTKLISEYKAGNVTEAIALVPARTDTQWIAALDPFHCCYIRGRLTFIGNNDPAPFPSVVYYLGQNTTQFFGVFRDFGSIKVELDEHWFTD